MRREAAYALGSVGGEKALALLEKALADQDANVRYAAPLWALGNVWAGRRRWRSSKRRSPTRTPTCAWQPLPRWGAWAGRRRWRSSKRRSPTRTPTCAVEPLTRWGTWAGRRRWRSSKRRSPTRTPMCAVEPLDALGSVGGEKALPLLEKALSDQDANVRA